MKASLKLREDQKPLVRAKIPISILGLPFISGVAAGDGRELRLDLSTAFESGPGLRVSYRPNEPWNPFSLVLKTGIGAFGSPHGSPMSMSAEFNLLSRGGPPSFSILFKPCLGDFSLKKSMSSAIRSPPAPIVKKVGVDDLNGNGSGSVDGDETPIVGFRPENGIHTNGKIHGFKVEAASIYHGGVHGLVSGSELTASSTLPLRGRAAVRFRWGLRVPPEIRRAFADGRDPTAGISLWRLPLLVMSKISIEHVAQKERTKPKPGGADVSDADTLVTVRRQLDALQTETGHLKMSLEQFRSELIGAKPAGSQDGGGADGTGGKPSVPRKWERRADGKTPEFAGRAAESEELKKALMSATGGAGSGK